MADHFERFLENARREGFFLLEAQLRQNGEVTGHWSRFPARPRFEVYSVSKTFAGIAAGIAMDEGLIRMEERLCDSFPEEAALASGPLAREITVRHLLTMTSGMGKSILWRDGWERRHARDWVRFFYENGQFAYPPGTRFLYNNANTYMLGCLIEKKSGQNLREFLRYRLFEPLEIGNPEWIDCPMGHTVAANGLVLNADELGRFGQLIADGGVWNGRRLVSERFVRDMLTPGAATDSLVPGEPPHPAHYGYQIWLDTERRAGFLWGIFGQYCVILPEQNTVITVIALQQDDGGSNGNYGISPLRERIWKDLVEAL